MSLPLQQQLCPSRGTALLVLGWLQTPQLTAGSSPLLAIHGCSGPHTSIYHCYQSFLKKPNHLTLLPRSARPLRQLLL